MLDLNLSFVRQKKILILIAKLLNIHILDIRIYAQKVIALHHHANLEKINLLLLIMFHIMSIHITFLYIRHTISQNMFQSN